MTGREDAPDGTAPEPEQVAEAYFREHQDWLEWAEDPDYPVSDDHKHAATLVRAALAGARPAAERDAEHERMDNQVLRERDEATDAADTLAGMVAPSTIVGEHSNSNEPWQNAMDYAGGPWGSQEAQHGPSCADASIHAALSRAVFEQDAAMQVLAAALPDRFPVVEPDEEDDPEVRDVGGVTLLDLARDVAAAARPAAGPGAVDAAARAVIGAAEPIDGFDPDSDLVVPAARMKALVAAAGPDDSWGPAAAARPAGDATTETWTECRVTGRTRAGLAVEEVVMSGDVGDTIADWSENGISSATVRVESRQVTTTRVETPWTEQHPERRDIADLAEQTAAGPRADDTAPDDIPDARKDLIGRFSEMHAECHIVAESLRCEVAALRAADIVVGALRQYRVLSPDDVAARYHHLQLDYRGRAG